MDIHHVRKSKAIAFGLILLLVLSACGQAAVPDKITLYLNGTQLEEPAYSPNVNGQLMLPASYLEKVFHKEIKWTSSHEGPTDGSTKEPTDRATEGPTDSANEEVREQQAKPVAPELTIDGEKVEFTILKMSDDNKELLIPLREFCKKYEIKLDWNDKKKKVSFSTT